MVGGKLAGSVIGAVICPKKRDYYSPLFFVLFQIGFLLKRRGGNYITLPSEIAAFAVLSGE